MTRFVGLDFLPDSTLTGVLIMMVVAAVVAGWISDAIMGLSGYGVIGNSILTLIGALAGLAAWRQFVGPMLPREMPYIMGTAGGCALGMLLLVAVLRRATG